MTLRAGWNCQITSTAFPARQFRDRATPRISSKRGADIAVAPLARLTAPTPPHQPRSTSEARLRLRLATSDTRLRSVPHHTPPAIAFSIRRPATHVHTFLLEVPVHAPRGHRPRIQPIPGTPELALPWRDGRLATRPPQHRTDAGRSDRRRTRTSRFPAAATRENACIQR